jgi:hypothetical protein
MRPALALCLVLALGACKKQKKASQDITPPQPMAADEIKRAEDACKAYVDKVCACTAPAAAEQCKLAKALPDAIRIALEVAASPQSKPDVVLQSQASVRKTEKECFEQTAKLPALGCN